MTEISFNGPLLIEEGGVDRALTSDDLGQVQAADSPSIDAFSRWRTSDPEYVFDANFEYDLQPLLFDAVTSGSGASITHDATNRNAEMIFASTPDGGEAYLQTYEYFRYQAGRSQLVLTTFNLQAVDANATKFVGYSDGDNGVELRQTGSAVSLDLLSTTDKGDESVAQASWNLDPMDGTGPSGVTLDLTKTHILVLDFQWLGVGRIRCGFDVDGVIVYAHEFTHANIQTVAYMATANLPVRAGMIATGTASTTMRFICASVISEGGEGEVGGYTFAAGGSVTAGNGSRTHLLSLRSKTTFNSTVNRGKLVLESLDLVVTGNDPVIWELCLGQAITGASWSDANGTYSAAETGTGTVSGSPAIVIARGYLASTKQAKTSIGRSVNNRYPLALDAAGAVRSLGTLSLVVTGIGATSATQGTLNWREIR